MAVHLPRRRALVALIAASAVSSIALMGVIGAAEAASTAASPVCKPWQARITVPPGVTLTPRVFPTDEYAVPAASPTATPSAAPGTPSASPAEPRVVCRNAPPTPFEHPPWTAGSVVGGAQLAARGIVVSRSKWVPPPPEVYDVSYVLADLDTGRILAAKAPHAWLRPASTLKTLTALTLLPRLDPRALVLASEKAQAAAGSRVGILAGNRYSVGNLVDAMMMFSANDAVYALADAAGGYDKTVALMNETAREIGAHDTVVVDPSGLDEGNQRSSAYDLALIARAAMRLPAFRAAAVKRDAIFPGGTDKQGKVWQPFHISTINELVRHYPGALGIKPGRTDRAQHTFIGAATRGGRTLVVTQMGSITGSWKPTAALLDWGFANADRVTPVGTLVAPGEAGPPTPQPTLPALRQPLAAPTTPSGSVARAPATGTPSAIRASVATHDTVPSKGRSLAFVSIAGACATALVIGIRTRHRRRRRPLEEST